MNDRKSRLGRGLCWGLLMLIGLGTEIGRPEIGNAVEAPALSAKEEFFQQKIRPLLQQQCFACHSHAKHKSSGGLMVDSRDALLTGGDSGPAIVPGDPKKSLLMTALHQNEDYPKMPPKGKLGDDVIALFSTWIEQGAVWPADPESQLAQGKMKARPRGGITDADRAYWAFQPVSAPAIPQLAGDDAGWPRSPVDHFILRKLRAEKLSPSPMANPAALIRRVTFDLTGLPPAPAEVAAFVADPSDAAYEQLVNRLLASPRYGERQARIWLDLVRYAESDGYRIDDFRPNAWRYRDWVIDSFNKDKPFDRFVREQLAGDELATDNPEALAATGFLRLGIYEYNNRDAKGQWTTMINDITDVVGDVFLGMGMGCARCHDHKFDPILQKDYYRLQAYFGAIHYDDYAVLATAAQQAEHAEKLKAWEAATAEIRAEIEKLEAPKRTSAEKGAIAKFPDDIQEILHKPESQRTPYEQQVGALAYRQVQYEFERLERQFKDDAKQKLIDLRKELTKFNDRKPADLPIGSVARDVGSTAPMIAIPKRPNEAIEPGILSVIDPQPAVIPPLPNGRTDSTGRRLALANWITSPTNPLTARVLVNRLWQQHFGQGIVTTASDFGNLSEPPSHPELLDWLASDFMQHGWQLKRLHKLMVLSATYRQTASPVLDPASTQPGPTTVDPENRWLWRMPTRRLEAEQIRDAVLAATGKLDLKAGGPSVDAAQPRRSIYLKIFRNARDGLLDVFDVPDGIASTPLRNITTTPTQSLLLINGPFLRQQAELLAGQVEKDVADSTSDEQLIQTAYQRVFNRAVRSDERELCRQFLQRQSQHVAPRKTVAAEFQSGIMQFREGKAALLPASATPMRLQITDSPQLPTGDFTLEAFVLLRSLFDDGTVRTIAAHGSGDEIHPGWAFGVTSRKSAFKPQSLVLQIWGESAKSPKDYEPIFSGLHVDLDKPYYVAVSVRVNDPSTEGITFYTKDLSNSDEPLQSAQLAHRITKIPANRGTFAIGSSGGGKSFRQWDGLIDDVRLSAAALPGEELLLNSERVTDSTRGYWQFEPTPGVLKDTSPSGLHIRAEAGAAANKTLDARKAAFVDLCHVLLNASEFLYVD